RSSALQLQNGNDSPTAWNLVVGGTGNGLGLDTGQFYIEHAPTTSRCVLPAGAPGWSCTSDRNLKDHITPVDPQAVLEQLNQVPMATWTMQGSTEVHLGPM